MSYFVIRDIEEKERSIHGRKYKDFTGLFRRSSVKSCKVYLEETGLNSQPTSLSFTIECVDKGCAL